MTRGPPRGCQKPDDIRGERAKVSAIRRPARRCREPQGRCDGLIVENRFRPVGGNFVDSHTVEVDRFLTSVWRRDQPSMWRRNTLVVARGIADGAPHPIAEGVAGPK